MPFGQGDNGYISAQPGYEGQIATIRDETLRTTVNPSAKIPFGRVLVRGSSELECALPSASGQKVIGVSVAVMRYELCIDANNEASYEVMRPIQYTESADIYLVPETDVNVTISDAVYFRHTANSSPSTYERLGRVRSAADGTTTQLYPNARFLESGKAGVPIKVAIYPPSR